MKTKITLIVIGAIIGLLALSFLANEFEIFGIKLWGVRKENAKYEVYKNTQSYNDGMAQQLSKIKTEWDKSTDNADRNALESKIRMDYANFDERNLQSQQLQSWLVKIRGF